MHFEWQKPSNRWARIVGHGRVSMEAKKLVPGSPEAKVALLHHTLSMSDGEILVLTRPPLVEKATE